MPAERPRRIALLVTIGLLSAFGPFGTDTYLPALPRLSAELRADDAGTQLTILGYLLGLGVGQLVWGPLSDRVGRRRPILAGTIGFVVVTLACVLAPSIELLVVARVLQGLLGAAGIVIGRAIVRDLYSGEELARIFSRLTVVFGLAPIVAPLVGAGLLAFTDWRGTFVFLAALGALLLVATVLWVPETLQPERRIHGRSAERGEAWRALARSPQFLRYATVTVVMMVALLAYITPVSLVLQEEWGMDFAQFSLWFALNALAGVIGGQTGGWLVGRLSPRRMLNATIALAVVASGMVLAAALLHGPFWLLELGLLLWMFGYMAGTPLSTALALEPFERGAGTAAAVAGAGQFVLGSIPPILVSAAFGASTLVMGVTIAAATVLGLLVATTGARRTRSAR